MVVIFGKKIRFLMDMLVFYYCFYFAYVDPGKKQYNLPELGAERSQASPGQRESPPQTEPAALSLGSSPSLPAPSVTEVSSLPIPAH